MQTRWNGFCKAATGILIAIFLYLPADAVAAERSFDRTLAVNGLVTLQISTGAGYIHVSPGSDNQVHIIGHVTGSNSWWGGGSSDEAVDNFAANPPINQAGNIIRVAERHGDGYARHVSVDYEITTPGNTMLLVESGSGDLRLSRLDGTVRAHTGSGSIQVDRLGAGSWLETGSGTVDATNLMGSATLRTGSGDLRAQFSSVGDVIAATGSGSIRLTNVQGVVKARTGSGSIEISGQPTLPWKLQTGSGDVTLHLGDAHFTLDAETGSGSVKSSFPLTTRGGLNKHHVIGTVNGGGSAIKVETGSGDINIQ